MNEDKHSKMELPESLARKMQEFEQRLKLMETVVAGLGGFCGVLLTYGILFISDRFWDTPAWLRAPLTFVGGGILGIFVCVWMHRWWWRRRDTRRLARLIQKQYRSLGDRLLGAVELANGENLPENISPALCRAAINQVAEESTRHDFRKAVEIKKPRFYGIIFFVLLATVIVTTVIFPQAGWNALVRWIKPLAPVTRYTFVSIDDMDPELIVPHGEKFEISCRLNDKSRWLPVSATCSIKGQPKIETQVSGKQAIFRIPGQTEPSLLSLRIGDVLKQIKIVPVYRPELIGLTASATLPSYLQRPALTNKIENVSISFLKGSTVTFEGEISRNLKSAKAETSLSDKKKSDSSLSVKGNKFTTESISVDSMDSCKLTWLDAFRLEPTSPFEFNVSTINDEAPLVECRGIARAIAILEDEVIELEISAEDDFGLKEMWINWSSASRKGSGLPDIDGSKVLAKGAPDKIELEGSFSFSAISLHVPEETMLSLYAYATDYMPGRKPAMSLLYRIYVLSRAQHSKLIQEQMEALQSQIEDLAREEEALLDKNKKISKQSPKELATKETSENLKESESTEKKHAEQLSEIAEKGKDLMKEALRNKDIPSNTLSKWSEMLQSMEKLAQQEMKQASKSLNQAGSSSKKRKENVEQAVSLEKKIVEELRKAEKDIDSSIKNMLAKSFINRLRASAAAEADIAKNIQAILPKTVGVSAKDLQKTERDIINVAANRQNNTRTEVRYIQDDLAGFYNRTKIKIYDTVQSEMVEKKTVENLTALATVIKDNMGVKAIQTASTWKDQLNAWADFLEKKMDSAQAQKGNQQQSLSEIDMEVLIALMRARQREESIRDQTRIIDEAKKTNRRYSADSRKLAEIQNDLARDTRPFERKVRDKKLRKLIEKIGGEMMNASMFLRRPQTDSLTIAIETEIIELLSSSIQSCSKNCGSAAQMVMAAMGMGQSQGMGSGAGSKGGGSMAGGTSDDPNNTNGGNADGDPDDNRSVEKGGGLDISKLPEEFRVAVEAYYNALENEK